MSDATNTKTLGALVEDRSGNSHDVRHVGDGAVATKNNRHFWIADEALARPLPELPPNVRDQLDRGRGLRYMAQEIDGVHQISGENRAREFLLALDERLPAGTYDLALRPDVLDATLPGETCVPVPVAREGTDYIMAWLAAHGYPNGQIAHALDVAESTVRVNLSKFKNNS